MLLTSAATPPNPDVGWAYEVKWDGMRAFVTTDESGIRVLSRHGVDFTEAFPELGPLRVAVAGRRILLDGELVCFGPDRRPSFNRIRRRFAPSARPAALRLARSLPATFVAFDVLVVGDEILTARTYLERRERLSALGLSDERWLTTSFHVGDGARLLQASRAQGHEGIVAKRTTSIYRPGVRSADWRKLKNFHEATFVVGGWLPANGGGVEALLVGSPDTSGLQFEGTVEFGLQGQRRKVAELLAIIPRPTPPFRGGVRSARARFVEPRLAARVRFIGRDAGVLREPILVGLEIQADF